MELREIREEQMAAWKRWKAGERDQVGPLFFLWYRGLIQKYARRAHAVSQNLDMEDYQQLCRLSICTALDTFNPCGGRLPDWIEKNIKWDTARSVRTQNGAFSIKDSRYEKKLQMNFGRDSNSMLEQGLTWGEIREALALKYSANPMDIDALFAARHGRSQIVDDFDEDSKGGVQLASYEPTAVDAVTRNRCTPMLEKLFDEAGLVERERSILWERYSNDNNNPLAMEKIAPKWGLSRERTRRILMGALEKLARVVKERDLEFEDLW